MNCRNGETYVRDAINSILKQTYKNWEIIFWDNQSTDNTPKILDEYDDPRIFYFRSPNDTSLYAARNLALKKITGDYIAFLDVDDMWYSTKLEKQIKILNKSHFQIACSNFYILKNNSMKKAFQLKRKSGFITNELLAEYYVGLLTLIIDTRLLMNNHAPFDDSYNIIGDFDLVMRLSISNRIYYDSEPLAIFRSHGENLSATRGDMQHFELKAWTSQYNHLFKNYRKFTYLYSFLTFLGIKNKRENFSLKNLRYLTFYHTIKIILLRLASLFKP